VEYKSASLFVFLPHFFLKKKPDVKRRTKEKKARKTKKTKKNKKKLNTKKEEWRRTTRS
jgi:hypothetical protein